MFGSWYGTHKVVLLPKWVILTFRRHHRYFYDSYLPQKFEALLIHFQDFHGYDSWFISFEF